MLTLQNIDYEKLIMEIETEMSANPRLIETILRDIFAINQTENGFYDTIDKINEIVYDLRPDLQEIDKQIFNKMQDSLHMIFKFHDPKDKRSSSLLTELLKK